MKLKTSCAFVCKEALHPFQNETLLAVTQNMYKLFSLSALGMEKSYQGGSMPGIVIRELMGPALHQVKGMSRHVGCISRMNLPQISLINCGAALH